TATARTPSKKVASKRAPAKRAPAKPSHSIPVQSPSEHPAIENPTPRPGGPEATLATRRLDVPVFSGTESPRNAVKVGLIDGLPDLGKFPAARRRRKEKASLPADGINQGATATFHVNDQIYVADEASQSTPGPQPDSTVPQLYASLSVEEQRLSLLDNFTKTGRAENPPVSPATIPTPTTENIPPTQVDRTYDSPDARPPPQLPVEGAKKEPKAVSFWPDHKRRVLAESACAYIATVTENKSITPDFISSLIEQNPSYVQLCHMLEGHGYTVNKVHFAKHLLQAFPDLGESSGKAKVEGQPMSQRPQPSLPVSSFVSQTPPPAVFSQSSPNGTSPQIGTNPVNSKPTLPLSREEQRQKSLNLLHLSRRNKNASQRRTSISASPVPQPREPLPNSKEAMARKRTFAEIMDLCQPLSDEEDDEEDEGEEVGQPNHADASNDDPMDTSPDVPAETSAEATISIDPPAMEPFAQTQSSSRAVSQTVQTPPVRPRDSSLTPKLPTEEAVNLAKSQYTGASHPHKRENIRRYAGIVMPMNKAKALKRSYYDPRTIARDILIAAGRHPTERPLNQHLLKLKEKFQYMDYSSDLETFRWDPVDPGGPPPPKTAPVPIITQPKFDSRDTTHSSRDSTSSPALQLPAATTLSDRAPSQLRNSLTVNADAPSNPMAPTQASPSFASPLPTRSGPRRVGRPPGAKNKPKPAPSAKHVEVAIRGGTPRKSSSTYQIYECHFDNCSAKLHNFDIFRKHVLKLHGRPDKKYVVCMWEGCAPSEKDKQVEQSTFDAEGLKEHLDSAHLSPLAWKLGDGPKSISSGHPCFDPDACLYDDRGRAVIPKATTNGATPSIILPTTWRPIRDFNKSHGYESDRSSALQIMRALETKQANVGVGLGPGGCILMNEERQSTVAASDTVFKILPPSDSNGSE
ncbi:hypothetical protein FQN49_006975, partial [Arthroderma sp. PD_2]